MNIKIQAVADDIKIEIPRPAIFQERRERIVNRKRAEKFLDLPRTNARAFLRVTNFQNSFERSSFFSYFFPSSSTSFTSANNTTGVSRVIVPSKSQNIFKGITR